MTEETDRLQKLINIASDLKIPGELRFKAITQIGTMGTHEALVALLDVVGNKAVTREERLLALKQAARILGAGRPWWHSLKPRVRG